MRKFEFYPKNNSFNLYAMTLSIKCWAEIRLSGSWIFADNNLEGLRVSSQVLILECDTARDSHVNTGDHFAVCVEAMSSDWLLHTLTLDSEAGLTDGNLLVPC
jgi:hypothetical protein